MNAFASFSSAIFLLPNSAVSMVLSVPAKFAASFAVRRRSSAGLVNKVIHLPVALAALVRSIVVLLPCDVPP
jgi:hypothetical protein